MHNSAICYIRLFHGRTSPTERLSGWGSDGPVIGPVGITFTYGDIKLHSVDWSDFTLLPIVDGLVKYQWIYYGDFEVIVEGDGDLFANPTCGTIIHSYETFANNVNPPSLFD